MIAGPLAVVPILIVPIVLGVSALTQPILKKYSDQNLATQQGKMTILHEKYRQKCDPLAENWPQSVQNSNSEHL